MTLLALGQPAFATMTSHLAGAVRDLFASYGSAVDLRTGARPALEEGQMSMAVWQSLGDLAAADLSTMAGHPFRVSKAWPKRFTHHLRSAMIPMSLAGDELEARISVVVDAITLRWVKSALLGNANASADAVDDALRELANTAGGAVKRAALAENVVLTTGIPTSTDNASSHFEQHSCWTLAPEGSDCFVAVVGEIRQRANQRVAASQLTEGMVLAHDVRNESGILLVPAGSRLTSTSAIKLSALLGPRFFLEVAPTS